MIGRRLQNYKIISVLGEGGMGTVYKAIDVKLERFAAIKILNTNTTHNSLIIERFKREARNQARLKHPNIVSVYGFVEEKDLLGIAMEFIEGETIESMISDFHKLDLQFSINILLQVLSGIEYAHSQGFIHRDLKPSNLIVDENGNAKIMDFGISKSFDEIEKLTQFNARPGTLLYMSPEQLSGDEVTVKSDLYALGITLYEMLSGNHPYPYKTYYDIVNAHVNQIPQQLSIYHPEIPPAVDEIILKAIGKSVNGNFNSSSEFYFALKNFSDNYIYTVNPQTSDENFSNEIKIKNKKFQSVTNLLLLIVFVGLAFIVYKVIQTDILDNHQISHADSLKITQNYARSTDFIVNSDWEFIKLNANADLTSVSSDNNSTIIAGKNSTIYLSNTKSKDWRKIDISSFIDFYDISFNDDNYFLVGSNGKLLKYNSESNSSEYVTTNVSGSLFRIKFVNHNLGFIVGSGGLILRSIDGGISWIKIITNIKEDLFAIDFSDEKNGFIVGWNGIILTTNDAGVNWYKSEIENIDYLKDVKFLNQFIGVIAGAEGKIFRTTDAGKNWKTIKSPIISGLTKIYFDELNSGYILSNRGEILKSSDKGITWQNSFVGRPVPLTAIGKLYNGRKIIVGNNGSVFIKKNK